MTARRLQTDGATVTAIVRRRSTADELRDIIVRQAKQIASLRVVNRNLKELVAFLRSDHE